MQTVLAGLLYICCEVYLDDFLAYGYTEDEFIQNLELIFKRFEEYNLTIHLIKPIWDDLKSIMWVYY